MRPPSPPDAAPPPEPGASRLARAALALYPPSWRARYADEVRALLDDSGGGPAAVASVAWHALPAWFCPPRQLHGRPARMRASLATALLSWSMLAGLGLVFAQLTQAQGLTTPGHAEVRAAYAVFDVGLAASALVAGLGGLPLWLLMLRRARRDQRTRDTLYLLLPVLVPVAYLGAVIVTVRLVGGAQGVSQWWFLAVTLAGFAAAAIAAAGPGLALRRLQPRGPALRLAAVAGGVAAALMAVAAAAIVVAVITLDQWPQPFVGYLHGTVPAVYLVLVVIAATVTVVSAARGTRAALASPPPRATDLPAQWPPREPPAEFLRLDEYAGRRPAGELLAGAAGLVRTDAPDEAGLGHDRAEDHVDQARVPQGRQPELRRGRVLLAFTVGSLIGGGHVA